LFAYFETLFVAVLGGDGESVRADRDNRFVLLRRGEWHRRSVKVQRGGTLVVPGIDDAVSPEGPASVVVHVPALYRIVGVAGVVVAGVDLDPVPVRITQVQIEGVGHAMPSGAAFDVMLLAERAESVTGVQDLVAFLRGERDMVQPRPVATGQRDIVHGLFSEH